MPGTMRKTVLGVLALSAAFAAREARAVAFTHVASVYSDDKSKPLHGPEGVACGPNGKLVVADTANGRLLVYAMTAGALSGGAELRASQLTVPTRVQLDSKGNILALDAKTRRIVRLDAKGAFLGQLEFKGAGAPASVLAAAFKLDDKDNVYVLDMGSRSIIEVDPAGTVLRQVQLPKERKLIFTDLAVDAAGTLFAVDAVGAVVWTADKASAEMKPLTKSLKEDMSFPAFMTASKGRLYLTDQYGHGIVMLGEDGSYQGRQLSIGWSDGVVNYPAQLCINEDSGEAFLADRANNRVQVFRVSK